MKKLLNKPWFVAVLALGALVLVGHSLLPGGKGAAAAGVAPALASAPSALSESEVAATETVRLPVREALNALVILAAGVRDPFARRIRNDGASAETKAAAPDLVDTVHLSALWTQDGTTFSLINDRICQAGDELGRLKIESATQDGVWLSHWKGRDFISIGGDFTLKTPAGKTMAAAASTL